MHAFPSRRWSLLLLPVICLAALSGGTGCSTVQLTPDTLGEFRFGELRTTVDANFATAYQASKTALEEKGLFLTQDDRKTIEAELKARDRGDTLVVVKVKEVAPGQSTIKIRYGVSGDAARSQALFREIERGL